VYPVLLLILTAALGLLGLSVITRGYYNKHLVPLRRFSWKLSQPVLTPSDSRYFPTVKQLDLQGRFEDHDIEIAFVDDSSMEDSYQVVHTVVVPNALGQLTVSHATPMRKLGRWLGMVAHESVGSTADNRFVVQGASQVVREAFSTRDLERSLDTLFHEYGFDSVHLEDGKLSARRGLRGDRLEPNELQRVFSTLVRAARNLERRPVQVKFLGPAQHFALTGEAGEVRCPYCRDALSLDAEEGEITACPGCRTVHHGECFAEAGCTVLGCQEQRPVRERERERG
jgi:hypothetical protein